ncbi:hypothetical protein QQY66_19225 [Streptomyces sp. DG2A-72]|uniref:hypothetical protein n=1 Tax=Streptomyces sp. DG2A-72 TaxID=3051386 RepID=UPI00265C31D9|nr:hypothetical protein [Streptomyces sp. DG2A-72]MDO0933712.1 hypothetical protein [Streptomyces sp. DG2A-72]
MTVDGAVRLRHGTRLWLDDEVHTVTGVTDDGVRLRSESGSWTVIGVGHLLADPTFRPYDVDADPESEDPTEHDVSARKLWLDAAALFDKLTDKQLEELQRAQEHLLEMTTGFRSGSSEDISPGEPRPEYAPDLPLAQRPSGFRARRGNWATASNRCGGVCGGGGKRARGGWWTGAVIGRRIPWRVWIHG